MKNKSFYEVSVPQGLEEMAWQEISGKYGERTKLLQPVREDSGMLQFTYGDSPRDLLRLKLVLSLFSGQRFAVPRPKALMGHENFQNLLEQVHVVLKLAQQGLPVVGTYRTLYMAAAGSDSSVMTRLAEDIAKQFNLKVARDEGDLLVRIRRPIDGAEGWDVLVRMTPRPLSVRRWRVCDYEGALNAAVAHAVARISNPQSGDVFLNVGCGSGSILIERAVIDTAALLIGCDLQPAALRCAKENIRAAKYEQRIQVYPWDARRLPLADASVDVICSDLPFGHDVGSHDENLILYPQILKEAARVARPGARAVFLTHEIRLMETAVNVSVDWSLHEIFPITINGLNPRIYLLGRVSE
jgi:tRNA (guanine6-N2)-methyltransferase